MKIGTGVWNEQRHPSAGFPVCVLGQQGDLSKGGKDGLSWSAGESVTLGMAWCRVGGGSPTHPVEGEVSAYTVVRCPSRCEAAAGAGAQQRLGSASSPATRTSRKPTEGLSRGKITKWEELSQGTGMWASSSHNDQDILLLCEGFHTL